MSDLSDQDFGEQLQSALGSPGKPDFADFQRRHADAVAHLNPVVTAMAQRRRRMFARAASLAVAAAILLSAGTWLFAPRESAFAQAIKVIDKAETVSLVYNHYTRMYSEDGERTWLRKEGRIERAYMAPSSYRDTRYDTDGTVSSVDIEDTKVGKVLHLDMKARIATLKDKPSGQFPPFGHGNGNPFAGLSEALAKEAIEFVGERDVNGVKANVFRYSRTFPQGGRENYEMWLDPKSKQLLGQSITSWVVGYGSPKEVFFDPATAPDRNNRPEARIKKGEMAGTIVSDIVLDAQLDPKLFSLTPPEGFEFVEKTRPKVSEEVFIEWLRVTAGANDGMFVDTNRGLDLDRHNAISKKAKADRSEAEQKFLDLWARHHNDGNNIPMYAFADDSTEPKSFRYLGKGVKLGDKERIVCFYKLKGTNKYRAVYGDLNVKDVDAKDLPLPVDE